jgi:prepilin-type N-terminal cleavage/methylation domain-containing protein
MKKKGLTLVELLITLALMSIILASVYSAFFSSNKAFSNINQKIEVQDEGNLLLRKFEQDIAGAVNVATNPTGSELTVEKNNNVKNIYTLSGSALRVNNTAVISNNVKNISFKVEGKTVYINLTINNNKTSKDFSSIISVRNWR